MQKKVLYILNGMRRGGAEKGLFQLIDGGAFEGCELRVLMLFKGDPGMIADLERRNVEARYVSQRPTMTSVIWAKSVFVIWNHYRRFRPDTVVLSLPQANIAGRVAALFRPGTVIASFEHNIHLARRLYEVLYRLTSFRVDWMLADCDATAQEASERLYWRKPPRTFILPLVSFAEIPTVRDRPSPLTRFTLISAGRLSPVKNHVAIVRAVRLLRDRNIDVEFVLYGEGPLRDQLLATAETLGVSDRVKLPGFVEDWYTAPADIFVLPSRHEGLCIAALEAMSRGIPVVASNVGGLRDYGGAAQAVLLEKPEAVEIADAVEDLISNPDKRASMMRAGIKVAQGKFGARAVGATYLGFNAQVRAF